jgi:hypothetical protein
MAREDLNWIFDPAPASGAREGGLATSLIIEPELDKFVREVLQNARDQRAGEDPVDVGFTFYKLDGEWKERFLYYMGWGELEPHLEGAEQEGGITIRSQLRRALEVADNGPLLVLRIDDSGTRGLTGDEDPDLDPAGNFNALTRNTLVTSETGGPRGGSFGVGKSVLWRFSLMSTVLFSSRIAGNPRAGFRFFGRCELPFHRTDEPRSSWRGPGWYGVGEGEGLERRAVSGWDGMVEDPARGVYLDRPAQLGVGTSIVVVGFFEPQRETQREPEQIAAAVLDSAMRWFWPSMCSTPPAMRVSARVYDNDAEAYYQKAEIGSEVRPFMEAVSEPPVDGRLSRPGDIAVRTLPFEVPARKPQGEDPGADRVDASIELRLRLAGTDDSPDLKNAVAMMRGSGMIVKYEHIRIPLSDQSYHAVLRAGLARRDSDPDRALELFLRAAEPPSHNAWVAGTDRLQDGYRPGAGAAFNRLGERLRQAIAGMLEDRPPETEQGPRKLAELFPLAGRGGGGDSRQKFRTDNLSAHLEDGVWNLSGRIRRLTRGDDPWSFVVGIWLDVETGRGEAMPIAILEVEGGEVHRGQDGWRCTVEPTVREVTFRGYTEQGAGGESGADLRRTRARLDVRPRIESGR